MCGIFGYLNFGQEVSRTEIIRLLLKGLARLEYRGYDSAGIAFDKLSSGREIEIVKSNGNVSKLVNMCFQLGYLPRPTLDENAANQLGDPCPGTGTGTGTGNSSRSNNNNNNNSNCQRPIASQGTAQDDDILEPELMFATHVGIAHTRWATHGDPSPINSHPHRSDSDNTFVVVHNGIITNFRELKQSLIASGYKFESETDTEIFAKLLAYVYEQQIADSKITGHKISLPEIVRAALSQLDGTYAFLVKSKLFPGEVVAARMGSPLIIGMAGQDYLNHEGDPELTIPVAARVVGKRSSFIPPGDPRRTSDVLLGGSDMRGNFRRQSSLAVFDAVSRRAKEFFLSSDAAAIIEHTRAVIYLEDKDIVHIRGGKMTIFNLDALTAEDAARQSRVLKYLTGQLGTIIKGNFDHFMQKEIFEQTESVMNTMRGRVKFDGSGEIRLGGIADHVDTFLSCRRVIFLACGSSFHACLATRQVFEELSGLPVAVELASEFVDRAPNVFRDEVYVFVSQSGETADSLRALRYVVARGAITCGVTNTVGSAIARETDFGVHVNAGIEIGVASTKAYTSQCIAIILMALHLSQDSLKKVARRKEIVEDLQRLPALIEQTLRRIEPLIKQLSLQLKSSPSILTIGRGYNFATALEGALKIKEISYIHSEGISAAELKHGTLALIDESMPCILVATRDPLFPQVMSAMEQLRARHGSVIAICNEGDETVREKAAFVIEVPKVCDAVSCVLNVIPLQLLSYHLAVVLGHNVDQPRNLAKSVVV